jgi:ketosteroid isomerase-like protein
MSENLDLVRSIYADLERGDFSSAEWADHEIEFVYADGPNPGSRKGRAGMADAWRNELRDWHDYRVLAESYREVDHERVLVLNTISGRGKASGVDAGALRQRGAGLFQVRDGKVTRLVLYWDRDRALADLGLEESTTPDLFELVRTQLEALNRHDLDRALRVYAPDCVVEQETGTLEGVSAIRAFLEEWLGFYEEIQLEPEEALDLGNGVTFGVIRIHGRPVGSSGHIRMRLASVSARTEGLVVWERRYTEDDIEKARAVAERLAEERG